MELSTGVREIKVRPEVIDQFFKDKGLTTELEERIFDKRLRFPCENEYVVLTDILGGNQSALGRVRGETIVPVLNGLSASGIKPRNKEQVMAMDALLDKSVEIVFLTGRAGSGKTLLTLSAALEQAGATSYKRIILTRPMSWVGKHGLGALPGDVDEKFRPYLENYMCNLEYMFGGNRKSIQDAVNQYNMEFIPLQLIRGASWADSFIIADECQVLDCDEMATLGTRMGEGSKMVVLGDLGQRDEKIAREKTGMYRAIGSEKAQKSPIIAHVDLVKCERSAAAELFAEIFEV